MSNIGKVKRLRINNKEKGNDSFVQEIFCIKDKGVQWDANATGGDRQVTIIDGAMEAWNKTKGDALCFKRFKANITLSEADFSTLEKGTSLEIGEAILEISPIAKGCYGSVCKIYSEDKVCPMPNSCLFATVKKTGRISEGEKVRKC